MALPVKEIAGGSLRSVGGMREVIQDLVTPDLKAVKTSVDALQQELRFRTEALSQELKLRTESLQEELRLRDSIQTANMQRLEANQSKSFQALADALRELSQKIDAHNIELRERVAALEARTSRPQ